MEGPGSERVGVGAVGLSLKPIAGSDLSLVLQDGQATPLSVVNERRYGLWTLYERAGEMGRNTLAREQGKGAKARVLAAAAARLGQG